MKILNEAYEWRVESKVDPSGRRTTVAYIDPSLSSDNTMEVKDDLKRLGARWDSFNKRWFFYISNDPEKRQRQIETMIKPCVEILKRKEKTPSDSSAEEQLNTLIAQIDNVINAIDGGGSAASSEPKSSTELKEKLLVFKQELIDSFKNNTFREKMAPIIRYRRAQGASFSILNTILILMQDPDAKMVKSTSKWKAAEHAINDGAKPISLWVPKGQRAHSEEERAQIKREYLAKKSRIYGRELTSPKDLNIGDREILEKQLNATVAEYFDLMPRFYDIRNTHFIGQGEDPVGSPEGMEDIEWYDSHSQEDEKSRKIYDAAITAAREEFGLTVNFVPAESLNGARGMSSGNGVITLPENEPKTPGNASTIIHEMAHALLHQTYLSGRRNDSKENYAEYFVGREDGQAMVEQQAEITAWVVMRNFGYDMQSAKNYVACWGGDENSAAYAFDTISKVATKLINSISSGFLSLNESVGGVSLTGLDIANMLGPDAVEAYKKAKQNSIKGSFDTIMERMGRCEF